jgi:hypothetical protein
LVSLLQTLFFMASSFRYQLQPYAGSRRNRYRCPRCGQSQQLTRWLDTQTGELLPPEFGRCNRQDQCGYDVSPYQADGAGQRYVDTQRAMVLPRPRQRAPPVLTPPLCVIPEVLVQRSCIAYERNQFARLLQARFGIGVAYELLARFEIGTSNHWPGATVFWQRDELGRVRGGQVVLFDAHGHTAKLPNSDGTLRRCTTWMHTVLARRYRRQGQPLPTWLTQYLDPANHVPKSPSLYGLRQLATGTATQSIALVEAPKTAVICAGYFPTVTWLAVGSLSQLTAERLRPLRPYAVTLYPDASATGHAYQVWEQKATQLRQQGFRLTVSPVLEQQLAPAQRAAGYDLADVLLAQWAGYPPNWDSWPATA